MNPILPPVEKRRITIGLLMVAALTLLAVAWTLGWFEREPSHGGKTVTEWLDSLVFIPQETRGNTFLAVAATDPAFSALQAMGDRAVPILVQRITDRAEWPEELSRGTRFKLWLEWKWKQLRRVQAAQRPAPNRWSESQGQRKLAAAVALLALGTNHGGGFPAYINAYATASKHQSIYGTSIGGSPVGLASSEAVRIVFSALPDRRQELVGEIMNGLEHTNAWCRVVSLECARIVPKDLLKRKDVLARLTRDTDPMVQETALSTLVLIVQQEDLLERMSRDEIRRVAEAVLKDPATSKRVRGLAETLFGLAKETAADREPSSPQQPQPAARGARR